MRQRMCRVCGKWHDLEKPWPRKCAAHHGEPPKRSHLAAPMVICDTMESTINHADGRRYSSKRQFERAVRAAGCEIVGNEKLAPRPAYAPKGVGRDIAKAWNQLGYD